MVLISWLLQCWCRRYLRPQALLRWRLCLVRLVVCPYWRRRLQQSQLLHCPSHHAGYLPGFLITQCRCYPQLLLRLGNLPEHDFQSVWCHCPWWFPTRCCFLQPAFPDDLVTLVLLNPVFCVLSAGRPGRLCRFRNHGTKEFRAGNSQQ